MRFFLVAVVAVATAFTANAQTSSPKKPAAEKPPEHAVPPIPQTSPADTTVSAPIDKNAPPLDPKNMDTAVKPAEDFYLYANGGWIKRNPIPPEFARWGSFVQLAEQNNEALHTVAEKAAGVAPKVAAKPNPEKAAEAELQKVGDFYASGMNEKAVDAAKTQPLADEFKHIDGLKERGDVLQEI